MFNYSPFTGLFFLWNTNQKDVYPAAATANIQ